MHLPQSGGEIWVDFSAVNLRARLPVVSKNMAETPSRQLQQPQAFNKMAVNSVDHGVEDSRIDFSNQEMDIQIQHRGIQKVKSAEGFPKPKKGSFMITRVVTKPTGDGEDPSADDHDLDETNTEDLSSDLLDVSKTTDIEPDMSSEDTVHSLAQEELLKEALQSTALPTPASSVVPQSSQVVPVSAPPPSETTQPVVVPVNQLKDKANDSQSRFKVVKIESNAPFKRGRWRCLDYLDPPTSEKPSEKVPEKVIEEVGSGNSSAASSVHYVPGVDDPSKNPLVGNVVQSEGHQILEPKPIHPLQNGDIYSTQAGAAVAVGQVPPMGSVHIPNAQMAAGQGPPSNIIQTQPPVNVSESGPGPGPGQVMQTTLPTSQASQQSLNSQAVPMTQSGHALQNVISTQANISSQHQLDVGVQQQYTQPQAIPRETPNGHVVPGTQASSVSQPGHVTAPSTMPSNQAGMQVVAQTPMQSQPQQTQQQQQQQVQQPQQQQQQQQLHNLLPTHQAEQTQDFIKKPAEFSSHANATQTQQTIPQSQLEQADFGNVNVSQTLTNNPSKTSVTSIASDSSLQGHIAGSSNGSPNNDNIKQNKDFVAQDHSYAPSLHVDDKQQQQQQQQQTVQHRSDHSSESRETLAIKHMSQTLLSPPLLEMVSATMQPNSNQANQKDDDDSNASTVAIDNKIEQAMDLVKSHLMFAVREEVEVLKEQIKELTEKNNILMEKNSQLEYENNILKGAAAPETLAELQVHNTVVTQPSTSTS